MNIHEFQGKAILQTYGVPVQEGFVAETVPQSRLVARALKKKFGADIFVVKAQIHAGGRGKGKVYSKENRDELVVEGGVKFIGSDSEKGKEYAAKLLGNILVTHQTGGDGKEVQTLFITEGIDYKKELYIGNFGSIFLISFSNTSSSLLSVFRQSFKNVV